MRRLLLALGWLQAVSILAQETNFDGRPWNISTGNLSVAFIQHSPIGALPRDGYIEAPPAHDSLVRLKQAGLVAYEDYIGWGAVERAPGQWSWAEHDAMEKALHKAGLEYVAYTWVHFPPLWLREEPAGRTLMRCLEHNQEAFYLSIFDPRTIEWYDRFYKNLHDHFGNRIDGVYACILGPYGEGNYPLLDKSWVNMGHCHEGYWCGDPCALAAFAAAMKQRYLRVAELNSAWGANYASFDDIRPPAECSGEDFKPSPGAFPTPQARRRWLDFITWYDQAIIDFAGQSVRAALEYFPPEKVRAKPGGSAGGVNPLPWGTYCPGYAKMAQPFHIVLQPADCQGAVFADKWMGTAYQFYGVKEGTEPAGGLNGRDFIRRMFSDASCGAAQFFTYEFEARAADMRQYVSLYADRPGDTEIAVYAPTTLYRLGASLQPTIAAAVTLRDLCEFDVLDELLIADGALAKGRWKDLLIFQADIVDKPILNQFDAFQRCGGRIFMIGAGQIKDVAGRPWPGAADATKIPTGKGSPRWLAALAEDLAGAKGVDGKLDGLWTCRRGSESFVYNSTAKPVETAIDGRSVTVAPYSIWRPAL
ncbi:MAG TPA: family 14 glycosylhydrolase [Verrucomicrobiae bacterium]|jgi:hypothetical protein